MDFLRNSILKPEINEIPRRITSLKTSVVPFSELWQTVMRHAKEQKRDKEKTAEREQKLIKLMCRNIFDLKRVLLLAESDKSGSEQEGLLDRLRMVVDGFIDALDSLGYAMESLDGRKWAKIDPDVAEIQEFIQKAELDESTVTETLEPLIKGPAGIVQPARVIVCGPSGT